MKKNTVLSYFLKHKYLYLMLIPALVYYVVFHYLPMYGTVIAFKDFNAMKGIMRSPWVGLVHFQELFKLDKFYEVVWNTLSISLQRLFWGFPVPLIVALLLHEVKNLRLKKAVQTAIYLPHFISWVVLGGILTNLLSMDNGLINGIIQALGGQAVGFLTDERYFLGTMIVSMIWKTYGWNTIIYMAALSGVDTEMYEAARIDGANRWQQLIRLTLPAISGTIIVVLILRIGGLMQAGFEQIFVLYNPAVYRVADIIDTYVYRIGIVDGNFEQASAVGLFKSIINFVLLVVANKLSRMFGEEGVY